MIVIGLIGFLVYSIMFFISFVGLVQILFNTIKVLWVFLNHVGNFYIRQ